MSALSAHTRDRCQAHTTRAAQHEFLTVAEKGQEAGVVVDRLFDAQHATETKLVVEHPFAQSRLHDIGAVETAYVKSAQPMGLCSGGTHQSMQLVRTTELCLIGAAVFSAERSS